MAQDHSTETLLDEVAGLILTAECDNSNNDDG